MCNRAQAYRYVLTYASCIVLSCVPLNRGLLNHSPTYVRLASAQSTFAAEQQFLQSAMNDPPVHAPDQLWTKSIGTR